MALPTRPPGARYEIVVRGSLGPAVTAALVELDACPSERGSTRFEGWVPDRAALQSFLSRLAELGIDLISVRRIDPTG